MFAPLFFRRESLDPVTLETFLDFVGGYSVQAEELQLPVLPGEDLHAIALAMKAASGGLDGWGWNELKALPCRGFVGSAWILRLFEDTGTWPWGLSDAHLTMIPKVDGDSTPLRSKAFLCPSRSVSSLGVAPTLSHAGQVLLSGS